MAEPRPAETDEAKLARYERARAAHEGKPGRNARLAESHYRRLADQLRRKMRDAASAVDLAGAAEAE